MTLVEPSDERNDFVVEVIDRSPLRGAAFAVHVVLARHANVERRIEVSYSDIATLGHMDPSSAKRALRQLVEAGCAVIVRPARGRRAQLIEVLLPVSAAQETSVDRWAECTDDADADGAGCLQDGRVAASRVCARGPLAKPNTSSSPLTTGGGGSSTTESRDIANISRDLARRLWERCDRDSIPKPVVTGRGNAFMAVAKLLERFLDAGVDERALKRAVWDAHRSGALTANTISMRLRCDTPKQRADNNLDVIARNFLGGDRER